MNIIAGKYEIIGEIGAGGTAAVFLANHIALQQQVVLKKLFGTSGSMDVNRLEIDILKNLQHEHLPRVYDFFVEDGYAYSVMEYIPGKSLDKLMEEGYVFKEQEVVQWAKELCDTLVYMHRQKPAVLHCDIKPSNIILSESGKIYLIDFNISSYIERNKSTAYGYTPEFASPEQKMLVEKINGGKGEIRKTVSLAEAADNGFANEEVLDERTDIYSLGATLFYLLTGISPNSRDGWKKGKNKVKRKFEKILFRALQEDRDKRYRSAKNMLHDLNQMGKSKRGPVLACLAIVPIIGLFIYLFQAQLEQSPDPVEQAAAFFQDGEYEQAVLLYQELADGGADSRFYNVRIADCYYCIGNMERALEFMHEKYADDPHKLYRDKLLEYLIEKCQQTDNIEEKIALEEERIQLGEQTEELYLHILQYYSSRSDYNTVQKYLSKIEEDNLDIEISNYKELLGLMEKYESLFHDLYNVCRSVDEDSYFSWKEGEKDFYKMARLLGGPVFYDEGEGNVLGIYNSGYLYFGEMENGKRQGFGKWIGIDNEYYAYFGEWENDMPNGHGTFVRKGYYQYEKYESNVINGFMDGPCSVTVNNLMDEASNGSPYEYTYINKMGHPQKYLNEYEEKLLAEENTDIPENFIVVAEVKIFPYSFYIFLPSNELRCVWGLGLEGE